MDCLEENILIDLSTGCLDAQLLSSAEEHLDRCADCRFLLAELLEPDRMRAPSWELPRGERVGRYLILDRVGVGGMGTVYAAYDTELRRKVALKLLHARTLHETADGQQLLREAQAMARLHHVNILMVHDVGAYGGHVFLSMELVEGVSLRTFLKERTQTGGSFDELREVFLAAGAGLFAAHRAGVVHCDFKPDNVLRSADGRIRVTDFGLARLIATAHDREPLDAEPRSRKIEPGGSLPYMAPEQLRGDAVTAASDQWSFCVALYEAVHGVRPFAGRTTTELLRAIERAPLHLNAHRPASWGPGPAWLAPLLARGLSVRPQDRFPSMGALLEALSRRPGQRTRRVAALLVITLALLCGIGGARWLESRPLQKCQAAAKAQIWFEASPSSEWTQTRRWPELVRAIAAARDHLTAEALKSCADTLERHSQTAATHALRLQCIHQQSFDAAALVSVLSMPPRALGSAASAEVLVEKILNTASPLPNIERCSAGRVLLSPSRNSSKICVGGTCDRGRQLLAAARIRRALSAYEPAQTLLDQASQLAASTDDVRLRAEVRLEQGLLWRELRGQTDRGLQAIKESLWLAQRAGDDEQVAICWQRLLETLSTTGRPEHLKELHRFLPHAQAAVTRIGGDAALSARLTALSEKR